MSKYIYTALSALLVSSVITLVILGFQVQKLNQENNVLKETILIKDKTIEAVDTNIEALKEQISNADRICENRIKARQDIMKLQFQSLNNSEVRTTTKSKHVLNGEINEIIDKNKSLFAIDSINGYWMQFTHSRNSQK